MWTSALGEPGAADRDRAGGKSAGLSLLVRAGLPVPPGFAVLAPLMDAMLSPAGGAVWTGPWSDAAARAEAARRMESLRADPFPPGFEDELRARLAAFPAGTRFAVRSSAVEEDARERSAAGQHVTALGVEAAGVAAAIRACLAGAHAPRAAVYRARTGRTATCARAGAVVQAMAPAEVSGVVFTRDPLDPRGGALVVEAARGTAGVVGGGAVEHRRVGREPPHPVSSGGSAALLGEEALRELARLALAGERALGAAADLEWAWSAAGGFALLQLRPITPAVSRAPRAARRGDRGILWTLRFSGERWTEPVTPLGWSLVEPSLSRFSDWRWASRCYLRGTRLSRLHEGIPYFNVTILRHLLLKTPWTPAPEFALELFPPEEAEALRSRRWILPSPGLVALVVAEAILRGRWRGHRWLWFTNPRDWERLAPRLLAAAREAGGEPPGAAAALAQLERLRGWLDRYVGVHLWSLFWANVFYQLLGLALARFGGAALHALRSALVTGGAEENLTVRANRDLFALAVEAARDEGLRKALLDAPTGEAAWRALGASPLPAAASLRRGLVRLLEEHGHRSRASWEVFAPRWRDEPATVLEMVRAAVRAGGAGEDREARLRAARVEAEVRLARELHGWRLRVTRALLARARVFSHLRENQRAAFDHLTDAMRRTAGALGRLALPAAPADTIRFLGLDEVRARVAGDLPAHEALRRAAERRRERERQRGAALPPFLAEGAAWPAPVPGGARVLHGAAVSPGRYRGPARIARTLDDASRLQPGEVLVVKAADPGWTPYFAPAGALVSELGGQLSHAAVVARECGLPAVAGIAGVTDLVRDGDEVVLDGGLGVVYIARTTRREP